MADNAFVKIGTALIKHQVKKLVGEETLEVVGEELADIGGDKLDAWLNETSTIKELEKAAKYAHDCFHDTIEDHELEQWMISLPIGNLPKVAEALEKLPLSSDEKQLENALRESIADWKKLSSEQIGHAVNSFLFCLRSALLPIEKQTLMVIGRSVLRTEDKVDLLLHWFEEYIISGKYKTHVPQQRPNSIRPIPEAFQSGEYDEEIPDTTTILAEGKILQIVVSQMFRLADLLTYPEGVKAKRFYEVITDSTKYRRLLNRKKGFEILPYGILKPATTINDQYDRFWKTAIPNLRMDIDPLSFIPFELDLSEHLKLLKPDPGSILESALKGHLKAIQNIQIQGNLRIYPPGTGIIRMSMTLEFRKGIHIEIAAQLARNIESLLFVDPNNPNVDGKPCESIFLEIIDKVAETFFKDEMFIGAERRWQPPETMFNFRDFHGKLLNDKIETFAKLMMYAPANYEKVSYLEKRIAKTLTNPHWQNEKVFAVASQGVALVIIPISNATGKRESQKKLIDAFVNTRELIAAATYAIKSFAERLDELHYENKFETVDSDTETSLIELYSFTLTMQRVLQAITSVHGHLHRLGKGELMTFARDLWTYDNPVDFKNVYDNLNYISKTIFKIKRNYPIANKIENTIFQIIQHPSPFPSRRKRMLFQN